MSSEMLISYDESDAAEFEIPFPEIIEVIDKKALVGSPVVLVKISSREKTEMCSDPIFSGDELILEVDSDCRHQVCQEVSQAAVTCPRAVHRGCANVCLGIQGSTGIMSESGICLLNCTIGIKPGADVKDFWSEHLRYDGLQISRRTSSEGNGAACLQRSFKDQERMTENSEAVVCCSE
eukprot:762521-Hanusia_phi.AAC.2